MSQKNVVIAAKKDDEGKYQAALIVNGEFQQAVTQADLVKYVGTTLYALGETLAVDEPLTITITVGRPGK
jgi:hypothetical protein